MLDPTPPHQIHLPEWREVVSSMTDIYPAGDQISESHSLRWGGIGVVVVVEGKGFCRGGGWMWVLRDTNLFQGIFTAGISIEGFNGADRHIHAE